MKVDRRGFLQAVTAAGLTLGWRVPGVFGSTAPVGFEPNEFLRIATDNTITIWVIRMEMGQGVRTLLPMMIADELEVELSQVRLEQAGPGGQFKDIELHTSGSSSSTDTYRRLRTAGAAAREMLVAAAAAEWRVDAASCRAERGAVLHLGTGRRLTYGQLADAASHLPVPARPVLKESSQLRLLGHPMRRVDGPDIVTGRARFGLDVRVPGLRFATIERAPAFGARLVRFDASAALAVPGVLQVLPVTKGLYPGVAVVATETWAALQGRAALKIEWTSGVEPAFDSDRFLEGLPQACTRASFEVRHEGDATTALATSARRVEATYIFPFQAHAPLEAMNCTADVRAGSAEIWVPTQTAVRTLQQATRVTGLPADRIQVHCLLMGGAFGRRLFADFVAEAVEISQVIHAPVQVMWTRQDDMRSGYFEPATAERFVAGLSARGALTALVHQTTDSDLTIYDAHNGHSLWSGEPKPVKAPDAYARDQSPWGAYDNPYEIPNLRVDCADVTTPVPTGPWRAVEYPSTVFGRESFLDELAHAVGRDPIALRLELLPSGVKTVGPYAIDRGRLARVLAAARDRSGWLRPIASDERRWRGRGVAANVYHAESYLAMVVEVSIARDWSDLRVEHIVTIVDCGFALNPLGIDGQTESGITWGLSATLLGKIDFRASKAVQGTYGDFRVIRMHQMPTLETVILNSGGRPGGFGEHPVPLVAPAVANAVFAACGKRARQLPITPEALSRS